MIFCESTSGIATVNRDSREIGLKL
jgi:hypothetical protein